MLIRRFCPLALIAFAVSSPTAEFSGKVVGISDGDTITVLWDRSPVKIRLHGIDCPEHDQDFGTRAKSFTSELAFGRVVTVRPVDTDRYRRTVANVVLPDGHLLNHEIVRAGYACWYRRYAPRDAALERLEREARHGLWSPTSDLPLIEAELILLASWAVGFIALSPHQLTTDPHGRLISEFSESPQYPPVDCETAIVIQIDEILAEQFSYR